MTVKVFEVRDSLTYIGVMAIRMRPDNEAQAFHMRRVGFLDGSQITLMRLNDQKSTCDPYEWPLREGGTRTMQVAHVYIEKHFDSMSDGDVVDVQFISGETTKPKTSERETDPSWTD